ncbi:MAG TPA: hypothetical protein VGP36_23490 [Mycobacteriales bacterium]|nr:hypothetical protein [Mycobacteriales bacterium]
MLGGSRLRPAPERRRRGFGPLLGLLVVAGVCTAAAAPVQVGLGVARGVITAPISGGNTDAAAAARLRQVRTLLDRRSTALLRHDRAGWLAGVDPAATGLRTRQAELLANIAAVPLGVWRYTLEPGDETGRVERGGSWTVRVTLHYTLRQVDTLPTDRPLVLTFTDRSGRWLISADDRTATDGNTTWRGPWEHGLVLVRQGRSSLVMAHPANAGRLASFAAVVDTVVPRVRAVVGSRTPVRVAVIIPDDETEMAALVGERLVLGTIAAVSVADSVDTGRDRALGQRIVVNPANIERLGPLGRTVVLEHEVTHLATRGFTGPEMPIWLVEGLADWVAYRDSGLPANQVADELRAALGKGHWPGRLPVVADFRGDSPRLALAYEEAWSACRLIADRAGPAALVRLYRAVGTAGDPAATLDAQLRRTVGQGTAAFTATWAADVRAEFG